MIKLITDRNNTDEERYYPPSFFIQKELVYPPTYYLKFDPYVTFLAKEEIIFIILDYVQQIRFLVIDLNDRLRELNLQQIAYINENLNNSVTDMELRCLYEENAIQTNEGQELIAELERTVANIASLINAKLQTLNKKYNNVFSYYDGNYNTVDQFADNLLVENQTLSLSYFGL